MHMAVCQYHRLKYSMRNDMKSLKHEVATNIVVQKYNEHTCYFTHIDSKLKAFDKIMIYDKITKKPKVVSVMSRVADKLFLKYSIVEDKTVVDIVVFKESLGSILRTFIALLNTITYVTDKSFTGKDIT